MKLHILFLLLVLCFFQEPVYVLANTGTQSVKVLNQNILVLKRGLGSTTLEQRVLNIEKKILTLVNDRLFDHNKLEIQEDEGATNILYEDTVLISITKKDASDFKTNTANLANQYKELIKTNVLSLKKQRSPKKFIISIAYAIVATLILILLLFAFSRLFVFLTQAFKGPKKSKMPAIKIKNYEVVSSNKVAEFFVFILKLIKVVAVLFAVYLYVPVVLSFFPQTSELAPKLYGYIANPFKKISKVIVDFIPNLFFIGVICIVTFYFLSFVKFIFKEIEKGSITFSGFYKDWAMPTYNLLRFFTIAFSIVMIFPYLPGSNTPAFQGISVFIGVLLSLGSTSAIANVVGGIVITYMRPFKLGDRVKIAETVGDVIDKNLLVTRIKTTKNVNITIPNSIILGNHIVNYSASAKEEGVVLHTTVTIGYDVPWDQVHKLLLSSVSSISGILEAPKPFVLQTSLDDFYVSYELNAYTDRPEQMARIYSEMHSNIQDKFKEAGVEIMSPHYSAVRGASVPAIPGHSEALEANKLNFSKD